MSVLKSYVSFTISRCDEIGLPTHRCKINWNVIIFVCTEYREDRERGEREELEICGKGELQVGGEPQTSACRTNALGLAENEQRESRINIFEELKEGSIECGRGARACTRSSLAGNGAEPGMVEFGSCMGLGRALVCAAWRVGPWRDETHEARPTSGSGVD